MKRIRKRQLEFLGHIMRKEKLENLTVTGKIEEKRSRGRQRSTFMESPSALTEKRWFSGVLYSTLGYFST